MLRAEIWDCSHSSAAYYFRLGCREAEKSPHMEGWKPNSQHIRLAVTHTVVIKNDATFPPHTTFRHSGTSSLALAGFRLIMGSKIQNEKAMADLEQGDTSTCFHLLPFVNLLPKNLKWFPNQSVGLWVP